MVKHDVLVTQTAEHQMLTAAGVTVDETIPLELYRTMYPDVLTMPETWRENLSSGVFGTSSEAVLLAYLLQQRQVAGLPDVVFEARTEYTLRDFQIILSEAEDETFADFQTAHLYSLRLNHMSQQLFPSRKMTFTLGRAAIYAYLYEGLFVPRTREDSFTMGARAAAPSVLKKMLAESVKA